VLLELLKERCRAKYSKECTGELAREINFDRRKSDVV
jgi:hypothetical protein